MDEYTILGRIRAIVAPMKARLEIEEMFDLDDDKLYKTIYSIIDKLEIRNKINIDPNTKNKINNRRLYQFTNLELSLISELDKRDTSLGITRKHFPAMMCVLEIIKSIREAYMTAHKIGMREIKNTYVGNDILLNNTPSVNGRILYEGYSKSYDLTIRFYYNFDLDIIENAYPVLKESKFEKK